MTHKPITFEYTEPPYFRLDVAKAYKHVRMTQRDDDISLRTKALVYRDLRSLTYPTYMLKELQDISMTYARQKSSEEACNEMQTFVYDIGGWFSGDALDKDFIAGQLLKGAAFGEMVKQEDFYAAALTDPIEESTIDDDTLDAEVRAITKENYSLLFLETRSDTTRRLLGKDSVIYNIDRRYQFVGLVASYSRKEFEKHGHDPETINQIAHELRLMGLKENIYQEAKDRVARNLANNTLS